MVIVIDPHGDLHNHLLNRLAQYPLEEIAERLVLIELYEAYRRGRFPGLNVLEVEGRRDAQEVKIKEYELAEDQVGCYRENWRTSWGERMGSILLNHTLLLQRNSLTLVELTWLLMDRDLREYLVSQTHDEDLKEYFEFFNQFTDREQHLFVESARSRSEAFVRNPYIQPILGQATSTIRFTELINRPGTIVLINASRSHVKTESRRLFLSLLFSKLHAAILFREEIPEPERIPLYIFVDEAHEVYYREAFLSLLSGGRKFNANLGLLHQSLSQFFEFGDQDLEVLLANTGIKCIFQVNRKDAERYAREVGRFSGTHIKYQEEDEFGGPKGRPTFFTVQEEVEHLVGELMRQHRREMYVEIKDGRSAAPYVATTLPVEYPALCPERVEALRVLVYQRYARSAAEVAREMAERRERLQAATHAQSGATKKLITKE